MRGNWLGEKHRMAAFAIAGHANISMLAIYLERFLSMRNRILAIWVRLLVQSLRSLDSIEVLHVRPMFVLYLEQVIM
jgi:hypothetical protein